MWIKSRLHIIKWPDHEFQTDTSEGIQFNQIRKCILSMIGISNGGEHSNQKETNLSKFFEVKVHAHYIMTHQFPPSKRDFIMPKAFLLMNICEVTAQH